MTETHQIQSHAGSREISILVFHVGPYRLGINLAKVREITRLLPVKSVPYSHPVVTGLFELRNRLIPLICLSRWLDVDEEEDAARIIIAEFLGLRVGFRVGQVEGIFRLQWQDIEPPERIKRFSSEILGTVKSGQDKKLINLIDYETIVLTVNPEIIMPDSAGPQASQRLRDKRKTKAVWVIEDSKTIRDFLKNHLKENGYSNIVFFENGKHALETLSTFKKDPRRGNGQDGQDNRVDIIISDIEMPVMNAYTFIKTIKEDKRFKMIPVVLFSSLISPESRLKGELVEADAQLSKSDSARLVSLLDRLAFR
jgi:two-component system chemotaxis response regulator CheV